MRRNYAVGADPAYGKRAPFKVARSVRKRIRTRPVIYGKVNVYFLNFYISYNVRSGNGKLRFVFAKLILIKSEAVAALKKPCVVFMRAFQKGVNFLLA